MICLLKERFTVCALLLAMCISCVQAPELDQSWLPEISGVHFSIEENKATLLAQLDSHSGILQEAGFYIGKDEEHMQKHICTVNGSSFTMTSEALEYNTDYLYCAFISNGINEIRTRCQRFSTGDEPIFIKSITFEDPYAELLCIRYYDFNDDGFLSFGEAASVESVDELKEASNRKYITSFRELEHFTALTEFSLPGCQNMKHITLPQQLESIGEEAFTGWESIRELIIPDNVRTIKEGAMENMPALEQLFLPDSLKHIYPFSVVECGSLTEIHIPEKTDTIEAGAFYKCRNLERFTGKGATEDGRLIVLDDIVMCFAPGNLEEYTLPESLIALGSNSMRGADELKKLEIGPNLVMIGENALAEMSSLDTLVIRRDIPPLCLNEPRLSKTAKIYVPKDALDVYKVTIHWRNYKKNIYPIEENQ